MHRTNGRQRNPRTRRVLAAAAAGLTASLAAGCIAPHQPLPGTGPWPAPGDPVTVRILTGTDTSQSAGNQPMPGATGMYSELVTWWNHYEAPRTRINVVLDTVGGGATAAHSEMLANAESGDSGGDDIIYNLDNEWVPEFAAGNFIWSLQGHLTDTSGFLRKPLDSGEYDGQLYAAPFTTDAGLLYYRTDLLTSNQLAEVRSQNLSFGELATIAQQVMDRHRQLTIGYAGQFADYEGLTVNLLEIAHGEDPRMFAPNGTIADSGGLNSALGLLSGYMAAGTAGFLPKSELGFQEADAKASFAKGTALFMRNWPIYYEQIKAATVGKNASQVADNFNVRPLPFPSVLGGQDLAIAETSPDPAAALKVIDYLTSPQAEQCLFQVGGFPATRDSAYHSRPLPPGYGSVSHPLCGTQADPGTPTQISTVIENAVNGAFLRPRTPYYTEFSTIIQNEVLPELKSPGSDISEFATALTATLNAAATTGQAPPSPSSSASPP